MTTALALRPGSKIEFVSQNLELTNEQLVEKAKASKIELKLQNIQTIRWYLRTRHGVKNSGSATKRGPYKAKAKGLVPQQATIVPRQQKKPKLTNEDIKDMQVRKLVFELGFDRVHRIILDLAARMELPDGPR